MKLTKFDVRGVHRDCLTYGIPPFNKDEYIKVVRLSRVRDVVRELRDLQIHPKSYDCVCCRKWVEWIDKLFLEGLE